MMAMEGARLLAASRKRQVVDGARQLAMSEARRRPSKALESADDVADFVLALGESPLAPPEALPAEAEALPAGWRRSRLVSALFRIIYSLDGAVYNARGLGAWKRKWRPREQRRVYCAVQRGGVWPPLREALAAAVLIL